MAKLKQACRVYRPDQMPSNVPAWRIVTYPNGAIFVYDTLEQANNSRIIARAYINLREQYAKGKDLPQKKCGWTEFARHLRYIHTPKHGGQRRSLGDAVSAKLYGNIVRGTLPKDERVRQMLIEMSGWPWE